MKYNSEKHNRRSLRLQGYDYASAGMYFITTCTHQRECLFGEVVNGEMGLNALGQLVDAYWQRLPLHFPNLQLDAFIVMPNHIHGILVLTDGRGAALGNNEEPFTENICPNATPHSDALSKPGVAFGQMGSVNAKDGLPNAAPLPPRLVSGSVGAIVLNFKSITTRTLNRIKRSPGLSLWQRNYYEHIIRDDESLQTIRQYVQQNPLSWQQDQLHPDNPSRW